MEAPQVRSPRKLRVNLYRRTLLDIRTGCACSIPFQRWFSPRKGDKAKVAKYGTFFFFSEKVPSRGECFRNISCSTSSTLSLSLPRNKKERRKLIATTTCKNVNALCGIYWSTYSASSTCSPETIMIGGIPYKLRKCPICVGIYIFLF